MTEKEFAERLTLVIRRPREEYWGDYADAIALAKEAGATFEPEVEVVWEGTADRGSTWRHRLLADGRWQHSSPAYEAGKWFDKNPGELHAELAKRLLAERELPKLADPERAGNATIGTHDVDNPMVAELARIKLAERRARQGPVDWADAAAREWFSFDDGDRADLASIIRRHAEEEIYGDRMAAAEGVEIIGELTASIAALVGESAPEKCSPDCGLPHLSPKANAAARKALDRWAELRDQLARVESVVDEKVDRLARISVIAGGLG